MDNLAQAGKQVEVVLRLALKMASRLGQLLAVFSTTEASAPTFLRSRLEITSVSPLAELPHPTLFCVIEYIGSWCSSGTGLVLKRKVKNRKQPVATQVLFKVIKSS